MDKQELTKIVYNAKMEGIKEGMKHVESSPSTKKALERISRAIDRLKEVDQNQDLAFVKSVSDIKYIKENMDKGFKRLEECIRKQNNSCFLHSEKIDKKFHNINEELTRIMKWRNEIEGALSLGRWILGFLGASTLINIIIAITNHYGGN